MKPRQEAGAKGSPTPNAGSAQTSASIIDEPVWEAIVTFEGGESLYLSDGTPIKRRWWQRLADG